jgi:hypothetical protein
MAKRPSLSKPALRKRLQRAQDEQELVRLRRSIPQTDVVDGFVIAASHDWVVLAKFDPLLLLDGWTALRIRDLYGVSTLGGMESVQVRALQARHQWPPTAPGELTCENLADLLRTATSITPLITLHQEVEYPGALLVGIPISIGARRVKVRKGDPAPDWADKPESCELADITRVEFGGH